MSEWYPVMLNLRGRLCVVAGGGKVAERKAAGLLEAGARIRIVSPRLTEGLRARLAAEERMEWLEKEAEAGDLDGAALFFAATGDAAVNARLASTARDKGIPVHSADDGLSGDFILPAVMRRGGLTLTVSTSGAGPALASRLVREISDRYGEQYAAYVQMLRDVRRIVKDHVPDQEERRRLLLAASEPEKLEELRNKGLTADPVRLLAYLKPGSSDRSESQET